MPRIPNSTVSVPSVRDPERVQGLVASPSQGDHALLQIQGPGLFLGAEVVKQGGAGDLTFVILDIDGRNVTNVSYAAVRNWGLTQANPFGLVLLTSADIKNLTIGFPSPLRYARELKITASVKETGVAQILANVIHGHE